MKTTPYFINLIPLVFWSHNFLYFWKYKIYRRKARQYFCSSEITVLYKCSSCLFWRPGPSLCVLVTKQQEWALYTSLSRKIVWIYLFPRENRYFKPKSQMEVWQKGTNLCAVHKHFFTPPWDAGTGTGQHMAATFNFRFMPCLLQKP